MFLSLFLIILFVNTFQQTITGYLTVTGIFRVESFIYSNYTEQSDTYIGRGQAVNFSAFWITNNTVLDYAWLSTNETGMWVNHSLYLSPTKLTGSQDWSNFTWQNSSITSPFYWKIYANTTNYMENVTSEGLVIIVYGSVLPEGIYYIKSSPLPSAGNYLYNFTILFKGETADAGDIYGCYINQSDCYDDDLLGCRQIFPNITLTNSISGEDVSITYILNESDIINSTLGGTTDNWIPWRIDRCGHYDNTMNIIQENTSIPWRIHVHPIEWTVGDIANAVNSKFAANMFMQNTIRGDNQGDIAYSVAKYGGSNVELDCRDGIDDPQDSDILIDCADPDCFGITHSCLPKQDFENESLYYSPSGSHGTLAAEIPPGDMGISESSFNSDFGETHVQYTMHQMPDGTMKMRFRHWGLSKTATIFVTGLPNISSVNKYFPGSGELKGEMVYFLDKNGDPVDSDWLSSEDSYTNRIALRSYLSGGMEITNLDTIINVTFDPNAIDMSEGHILTINLNYLEGTTVYEDTIHVTIYFDNTTYTVGGWNSSNEREDTIVIDGLSWEPCGDTKNGDFDLLNCNGFEINCFEQRSYDCYDPDCDMKTGPPAWNDYLSTSTVGLCAYTSESQTNEMCFDGYNNDWRTEDDSWGHANNGLKLIDCRDSDCDGISNGNAQCEYDIELNCSDGFDNDMYNLKDCELLPGDSYNSAEYDCAPYCRETLNIKEEKGDHCDDNIDNDWDNYYTTSGGATGYSFNTTDGAGMDCAWGNAADEDCHLEIMESGYRCELDHELTCDDEFNNDYDFGHGQPSPGWTSSAYESWFSTNFVASADFDDYDCQNEAEVPINESLEPEWCFDGIDNDMDAYYRVGDNFIADITTGTDCADPDCIGVVNPDNSSEICLEYEYNATDIFFINLPQIDYYCKNNIDDDADGPKDCNDPDCNKQFSFCFACPDNEMNSWDACADGFDNDYGDGADEADPDCDYQLSTYNHQFHVPLENTTYLCTDGYDNDQSGGADCADPQCDLIAHCGPEVCDDNLDNDGDNQIDCWDSDCSCGGGTDMSGNYRPPATMSGTYGGVGVTWTMRVRRGENFTANIIKNSNYADANVYLGRLTGDALPVGQGLNGESFLVTGPDTDDFETQSYNIDGTGTKAQIELLDQIPVGGINLLGFDITVNIPTNDTLSDSFEYYHSIDGEVTTGNILNFIILDDIAPVINSVRTSPTNGRVVYGESMWVGVNASDPENGDYEDGTISKCIYNVSSGAYFDSGIDYSDCIFSVNNLIDDGTYTLNVWAEDDTGNFAPVNTTTHDINIIPKYIGNSFILSDRWYRPVEQVNIEAQFYTDDASSIDTCDVYYQLNTGASQFAGTVPATNIEDRLICSGSIAIPFIPNIYGIWVNITDNEGDTAASTKQTFYMCDSFANHGTGTYGEQWDCIFSDMNNDGIIDYCKITSNHPPTMSLVSPDENKIGVSTDPELRVLVLDQDNDLMNIYFYDESGRLLGSNIGLTNGSIASYIWSNRNPSVTYGWYAVVTDGINTTASALWKFTTQKEISVPSFIPSPGTAGIVEAPKKSFSVTPDTIKPIINRTITSTEVVSLINDGELPLTVEVQIDPKLQAVVSIDEKIIDMRPDQKKSIYFDIATPEDAEPGIYIGNIVFYSEGIEHVVRVAVIVTEYPELVRAKSDIREFYITLFTIASAIIAIAVLIAVYLEYRKYRRRHR